MAVLVARAGRELQRYSSDKGRRQVVGFVTNLSHIRTQLAFSFSYIYICRYSHREFSQQARPVLGTLNSRIC